ncbi:MAG: hypothetical protein V1776_00700 [Candidatus Diapherotrites archaeon]
MIEEKANQKEKPIIVEILTEGPGGELYFQPIEATPEKLEELIEKTKNSMIKHNLEKQIERMKKQ